MSSSLELSALGNLLIRLNGRLLTDLKTRKAEALFLYMVFQPQPVSRTELATLFWADSDPDQAGSNLRKTLADLRLWLDEWLIITREAIGFDHSKPYFLDVQEVKKLLASAHLHPTTPLTPAGAQLVKQAVQLYAGEFLNGFYLRGAPAFEDWAILERERLHLQVVEALLNVAEYCLQWGEYRPGIQFVQQLLVIDPFNEAGQHLHLRLLARLGEYNQALAEYDRFTQRLARELEAQPTQELQRARERILAVRQRFQHRPGLGNPFIGRQAELAQLEFWLSQPQHRLITILGWGGIGKTRLAQQAAETQAAEFLQGVCFCALESTTAEFLEVWLCNRLDIQLTPKTSPRQQLLDFLRRKELLLVLDNFEHLLPAVSLITAILQEAPEVKLLLTSRELLHLPQETVLELTGLGYPTPEQIQQAEQFEAVQLFQLRAERVRPGFALTAENLPSVVKICQLVDGLPLGIELSAATTRAFAPAVVAQRIQSNLDFLATTASDLPPRHRNMRALFLYSWEELSQREQGLLCSLSVFRSPFSPSAAAEITLYPAEMLEQLTAKSLVQKRGSHYALHPLISQLAAEQLPAAAEKPLRERHCTYFTHFLQVRYKPLSGAEQVATMQEINQAIDDVNSAWRWAVQQNNIPALHQALHTLALHYTTNAWYEELNQLFGQAEQMLEPYLGGREADLLLAEILIRKAKSYEVNLRDEARLLYEKSLALFQKYEVDESTSQIYRGLGLLAQIHGQFPAAAAHLEKSLQLYQKYEDVKGQALVFNNFCLLARQQGDYPQAQKYAEESLRLSRLTGNKHSIAVALNSLGLILSERGGYEPAMAVLQEAVQLCKEVGYKIGLGNSLTNLATAAYMLHGPQGALDYLWQSLELCRHVGDDWGEAIALGNIAYILNDLGEYHTARPLAEQAVKLYEEVGIKSGLVLALRTLGWILLNMGQLPLAQATLHRGLSLALAEKNDKGILDVCVVYVQLLQTQQQQKLAEQLAFTALAHPALSGVSRNKLEKLMANMGQPAGLADLADLATKLLNGAS